MRFYRPRTAFPLTASFSSAYTESAPSEALRPYVCCFWSGTGGQEFRRLVVPDTCMDIIFRPSYASPDGVESCFCGISDAPFSSVKTAPSFGVRFYFWSAGMFADEPLTGSFNAFEDASQRFPSFCRAMGAWFFRHGWNAPSARRQEAAEGILLRLLARDTACRTVRQAAYTLLRSGGTADLRALSMDTGVGMRQLERLLDREAGVSPKALARMVRYQCVWQELLAGAQVLDVVARYRFTDQSHLLRDFRRFHTMTPRRALDAARNVAFLQDGASLSGYTEEKPERQDVL